MAADIKADHVDLAEAIESEALDAHFLLGNHDFDLWQWHDYSLWDRRYYLPGGNDPTQKFVVLAQRDPESGLDPAEVNESAAIRLPGPIGVVLHQIDDVNDSLPPQDASMHGAWSING